MESFNLNIIPGKDRPVCHASQFDIGRTIHVNLFEGFNVFTLDGTEVISISVRKPDGNVVTEAVTNTSDSYVEFVTTEQMTACHGSNLCELKLEKGADVIGTMNFILEVEQDPLDGGVQSDTQIHNLQTQVADLVAIEVADQYDSADVIFDNTPTAGHGVGYAVTSEGVKNAIDAAVGTVEDIIGDAYDENNTYNTGDYCIHSDVLHKCNDDNVTGAWDPTKWDATTVADELALKQNATDANLTTSDQTIVGAINELNTNKLNKSAFAITRVPLTSPNLNEDMYFFRQGNMCCIECQTILASGVTIAAGATLDLYTVQNTDNYPDSVKASSTFIAGGLVGMVRFDNTTGKITLYNQSGSTIGLNSAINFSLSYCAKIN